VERLRVAAHLAQGEPALHVADRLLYLQGQFGSDYGATMAFALVNVVPMVVVLLAFQRYFVQGFSRSGLR
jgi:ABC-type glycerol-3-phosphate transport system permease component